MTTESDRKIINEYLRRETKIEMYSRYSKNAFMGALGCFLAACVLTAVSVTFELPKTVDHISYLQSAAGFALLTFAALLRARAASL